jgi:hypothetical protein
MMGKPTHMRNSLFALLSVILLLSGCAKPQPDISWILLEEWTLEAHPFADNPAGALTHNFTEAFVNVDGKFIGAFQIPAKIPIIATGNVEILIQPGVINNGISATKRRYPFVEPYVASIELIKDETTLVSPVTRYYKETKFLIEDFENPAINIETDGVSAAQLQIANDPAILKWGNFYGSIELNDIDSLYVGYTIFSTNLPKQGDEVYLEMDYMNSNSLLTSVLSYSPTTFHDDIHIQLNPQANPEWKKIYLDLREIISFRFNTNVNEQGFTAILDEKGTEKFIYLDNIKVVYR